MSKKIKAPRYLRPLAATPHTLICDHCGAEIVPDLAGPSAAYSASQAYLSFDKLDLMALSKALHIAGNVTDNYRANKKPDARREANNYRHMATMFEAVASAMVYLRNVMAGDDILSPDPERAARAADRELADIYGAAHPRIKYPILIERKRYLKLIKAMDRSRRRQGKKSS